MEEPPPCDNEHNPLSAWARDYFEYQNFLLISPSWGWASLAHLENGMAWIFLSGYNSHCARLLELDIKSAHRNPKGR
jgi:hypothetical protein